MEHSEPESFMDLSCCRMGKLRLVIIVRTKESASGPERGARTWPWNSMSGLRTLADRDVRAPYPKSKGADLPRNRRPTLQSQFSQGESTNAGILNSFEEGRVAKTLR